jgi:hypothetical protein
MNPIYFVECSDQRLAFHFELYGNAFNNFSGFVRDAELERLGRLVFRDFAERRRGAGE